MKTRSKQTEFQGETLKRKDSFGGRLLTKRAGRTARPLSTKDCVHLVLKSSIAKGSLSFRAGHNADKISAIIRASALKNGVRLIRCSNNFNHLHLLLKISSRETYKRFIRSIAGAIAMTVTGSRKGRMMSDAAARRRFWDARPFSRIVRGRRGFVIADDYVKLNAFEAQRVIPKRKSRLRGLTHEEKNLFSRAASWRERRSDDQLSLFENLAFQHTR